MVKCTQVSGCRLQLKHFPVLLLFFLHVLRGLKNEMDEEQDIVRSDISVNYRQVVNDLYLPNVIFGLPEMSFNMLEWHLLLVINLMI